MTPLTTVWQIREELVKRREMTRTMRELFDEKGMASVEAIEAMIGEEEFCTRLIAGIDIGAGYPTEIEIWREKGPRYAF